jgi:hypothetical protein
VGQFTSSLTIGATTLTGAGGIDAFVAKLNGSTLAPVWNAVRFGGTGSDVVNGVGVTSFGDIVITGVFAPSTAAFKTANGGFDTNGLVQLNTSGTTASDAFIVKLNGSTGALDSAAAYGDAATQSGDAVAVNRYGTTTNQMSFVGTLNSSSTFGAAGTITAAGGTDVSFVTLQLQ